MLLRKLSAVALVAAVIGYSFSMFTPVFAGTFSGITLTLSNENAGASSVTHTVEITTATSATLKDIEIRYATTLGGSTRPAGLGLSLVAPGGVSGITGTWSVDVTDASLGIVAFREAGSGVSVASGTTITLTMTQVTNSAIDDCQAGNNGLQDTCHVRAATFDETGSEVDRGDVTYRVREAPSLTFQVEGVASGVSVNGTTTNLVSTPDAFDFGIIPRLQRRVIRHRLTITTNAPGGYTVRAYLHESINAKMNASVVMQPFGAVDATWTNPQTWTSPDGIISGSHTAWFGANTTDTRVSGWGGSTSNKFGPLGTTPRAVAFSGGPDRTGTTIYVTYALELNTGQPADRYDGLLVYDVQASY